MNTTLNVFRRFAQVRSVIRATALYLSLPLLLFVTAGSAFAVPDPLSLSAVVPSSFFVGGPATVQFTVTNTSLTATGMSGELDAPLPAPSGYVWTLGSPSGGCNMGPVTGGTQPRLPFWRYYSRDGAYRRGHDDSDHF